MVEKLAHYIEQAEKMIEADKGRDIFNKKVDDIDHVAWAPPNDLTKIQWFRPVPSTDGHDAISSGVRVLSALEEDVTLQPIAANPETKKTANDNEKILKWQMAEANKRRQGTVQRSVVRSALKYDEVVVQVIDLEEQIKNKKIFKADTKREKAALRYGRYVVNTYHPNEVHVEYSNLMPEKVLLAQTRTAKEVMQEWGPLAKDLKEAAENDEKVEYFYLQDYDDTVIWTTPERATGGEVEIMREEHKLPFLPWVARVGGDIMESKQEHRRRPLLYPIVKSGMWETQNVVQSFMFSEVIRNAGHPRWIEEGNMPIESRSTELETGDVDLVAQVTPGDTLKPAQPPAIDPSLQAVFGMIQAATSKSTLASVLQGGDVPAGTAFATLNLATQTAVGALKPGKELAEHALADIYALFLLWSQYTQKDVVGYGKGKADFGEEYVIKWDEIPEKIYLSVELKPDVPLDRQAKANTANMMLQSGIYSKERAMEDMGITDPDSVTEEIYFETLAQAQLQQLIEMQAAQQQMALQQQQQMAAQQAAAEQQAAAQQQQQALQTVQNEGAGVPGGQGVNPAMGGGPPQEFAPGATREGVTGLDRLGNERGGFE